MAKRHRSSSSPLATLCLCGLPAPVQSALRPPPAAFGPRLPGSTLPVVSHPHPTHQPCSVSPLCGPLLGTATSGLEQLVSHLALVDGVAVVHRARAEDLRTAEGRVHLPWRYFSSQQLPAAVSWQAHRCQRPDAHMRSHPPQRAGCQQTSLLHPVSPAPATVDAGPVQPHWRRSWHPPVSNKGPALARLACLPSALSPCSARGH